jgi:hypothetical protein
MLRSTVQAAYAIDAAALIFITPTLLALVFLTLITADFSDTAPLAAPPDACLGFFR